jgi:glycosyltransferase involved in cell wall biosynthesis
MTAPTATLPLRTTCVVTCYNYARFLRDSISSVLAQSTPFDEVIVIDDASTDGSEAVLSEICPRSAAVDFKVIRHEQNRGQLAAFETGVARSTGDIVCFLDADDVYAVDYLSTILDAYRRYPQCDFIFCQPHMFRESVPSVLSEAATTRPKIPVTMFGLTVVSTILRREFIGAPTSCISMRRWVADRIFPLPHHDDWRTRADDCLVFGASLAGARKMRLHADLVGYRIHGLNAFCQNPKEGEPARFFLRQLALARFFEFLQARFGLGSTVKRLAHLEFKTIPSPTFAQLRQYVGHVVSNGAEDAGRLRGVAMLLKRYLSARSSEDQVEKILTPSSRDAAGEARVTAIPCVKLDSVPTIPSPRDVSGQVR